MLDENKKKQLKDCKLDDELLLKPFELGWTREVVKRVVTKNRNLNCDIYYFSPSGKKIRSLTEIKLNLTDGLTPECFSFKRQPLGINENFETVRDARNKRKGHGLSKENTKCLRGTTKKTETAIAKATHNHVIRKELINSIMTRKKSSPIKQKSNSKVRNDKTRTNGRGKKKESINDKMIKVSDLKKSSVKSETKKIKTNRGQVGRKACKNKKILKKIITKSKMNQSKITSRQKILKNVMKKKEPNDNDIDKKSTFKDLRSIVKRNIGKYREMREKQKMAINSQFKKNISKIVFKHVTKRRSEPISKNKQLYLKPLEKGWRRELVYRRNGTKTGQRADVYYFHPNGKKLRSCREVSENCCGEPCEIIRKARSHTRIA
ncbi:conserved hypothetical protein [Pediculus humanus corporis]|uniref:MBD domain-containing protein n=1 Tax=Pediculus humanus subsp. corporis TaxID=121224 RepID=E0VM58_PEDHC|nr:uncharacterized protein Phum_PHUM301380 [Pediculus humanus corporis]EEB14464.1 conserved hypothetical protein [Pediculus humanus corporis]